MSRVQTETMYFYVFDTCKLQHRPVTSYMKTRRSKPVWTIYILSRGRGMQGKRDAGEEGYTMHGRVFPVSIAVTLNSVASLCSILLERMTFSCAEMIRPSQLHSYIYTGCFFFTVIELLIMWPQVKGF